MKKTVFIRSLALLLVLCTVLTWLPQSAEAKSTGYKSGATLLKESGISITTGKLETSENGMITIHLNLKNTSKKNLRLSNVRAFLQGYEISCALYCELAPGQSGTESVFICPYTLASAGIDHMDQLLLCLDIVDVNSRKTIRSDCTMTIPLDLPVTVHYNPYMRESIYDPIEKSIYKEDGFHLSLLGSAQVNPYQATPTLFFLLENYRDQPVAVRNEGRGIQVGNTMHSIYIYEEVGAYSHGIFSVRSNDPIFQTHSELSLDITLPLELCTGNRNGLVDITLKLTIDRESTIREVDCSEVNQLPIYRQNMKEYGPQFDSITDYYKNGTVDEAFLTALQRKYPEDQLRHSRKTGRFLPTPHEFLALYLNDLKEAGYTYEAVDTGEIPADLAYCVNLCKNGTPVLEVQCVIDQWGDPDDVGSIMVSALASPLQSMVPMQMALYTACPVLPEDYDLYRGGTTLYRDELIYDNHYMGLGYNLALDQSYLYISPDMVNFELGFPNDPLPLMGFVGATFQFGTYEQDNNTKNGPEPIEWEVLALERGRALVTTTSVLDVRPFHNSSKKVTWEDCSLRSWLNGTFYKNSFTKEEKTQILQTVVETGAGTDKVFLLSVDEVQKYIPDQPDQICPATNYALAKNVQYDARVDGARWWLRSTGHGSAHVASVATFGSIDCSGGIITSTQDGIRPALWIDIF